MSKSDSYRKHLAALTDWDAFLMQESGLPGPRGNLELAAVAAELGTETQFRHWLTFTPDMAPVNSAKEFLAFCGALGLGRLLAEGQASRAELRCLAADPRWRLREAVAMALQHWGDRDWPALLAEMRDWSSGNRLEQRAAAAALCEPRLLKTTERGHAVLQILDAITHTLVEAADRKTPEFKTLRQGMGYCWSVAAAADSVNGKAFLQNWLASDDPDVRWMVRENLKKKRLQRLDPAWVATSLQRLESPRSGS